jgi:hypothetical protein
LGALVRKLGIAVEEKDIRSDPDLEKRYRFEIPVLFAGDREVVRGRVSEPELRKALALLGIPLPR